MAGEDVKQPFPILEDASGNGIVVDEIKQGDVVAGKSGLMGFSFRDASGNAVAPQLTSDNRVPVSLDAAGNPLKARGEVAEGAASGTWAEVASISLNTNKNHVKVTGRVSCSQASLFQLCYQDDAASGIIEDVMLSPGEYTGEIGAESIEHLSGGSGTQKLFIRAFNLKSPLSPLRARLSAVEVIS